MKISAVLCFVGIFTGASLLQGCATVKERALESGATSRLVSLLYVPGLKDAGAEKDRWEELNALFRANGYFLRVVHTTGDEDVDEGARAVYAEANRIFPKGRFHVIAKSLGGLWTRKALHDYPDLKQRVVSVTTIATPHRGSAVADFVVNLTSATLARQLTTGYLNGVFNKQIPYDSTVPFYSFGFRIAEPGFLHANLISGLLNVFSGGGSDGLVSPESARWGNYRGTFSGEHIASTNDLFYFGWYDCRYIWREVFQRVLDNLKAADL